MSKEIKSLQRKLAQKEAQLESFNKQAVDLANIGPLKNHLEYLEFCLNEKQEILVALQLEFEQHKQEARNRQAEL